jgi:hypothetical protein
LLVTCFWNCWWHLVFSGFGEFGVPRTCSLHSFYSDDDSHVELLGPLRTSFISMVPSMLIAQCSARSAELCYTYRGQHAHPRHHAEDPAQIQQTNWHRLEFRLARIQPTGGSANPACVENDVFQETLKLFSNNPTKQSSQSAFPVPLQNPFPKCVTKGKVSPWRVFSNRSLSPNMCPNHFGGLLRPSQIFSIKRP